MFAPDVLGSPAGGYILLPSSGDRGEAASLQRTQRDELDLELLLHARRPTGRQRLASRSSNCGASVICLQSLLENHLERHTVRQRTRQQERLVSGAAIQRAGGDLSDHYLRHRVSSTHEPDVPQPGTCKSNLGTARVHRRALQERIQLERHRQSSSRICRQSGLPPSPSGRHGHARYSMTVPFCHWLQQGLAARGRAAEDARGQRCQASRRAACTGTSSVNRERDVCAGRCNGASQWSR